jgi:hypothetical protein
MVNVGSRWEHKVSMQAVQYWSASAGVLLVEWSDMYDDYFAHEGKKNNKNRGFEDGLDPLTGNVCLCKLRVRFRRLTSTLKEVISRHPAKKEENAR